jgi:hypothetical protein
MSADNYKKEEVLPSFESYMALGEFWDTHSLAEYWDYSEDAQLEFDPAHHRILVPIEPDLLLRLQRAAQARGISTESLVNLLLEQRLQQLATHPST